MTELRAPVTADDHAAGPANAPVTLVEYGDYECPHCARASGILHQVRRHFGPQLRLAFRNFPLTRMHPHAQAAAETAEFAAAHGKFWEMHDLLFEHQPRLSSAVVLELTRQLGLSTHALSLALDEGHFAERVRSDFAGVRSGVNGTPTFFLNGVRYDGSWELPELLLVIDRALEAAA
jgi:protein-disulfide isomerase